MKLPIPFFKKKKEAGKYYLALLIVDDKLSSAVLEEIESKIHIIGTHKEKLSSNFEHLQLDEQINLIDKTISRAEEKLPSNIETHKTIFGIKEDWVEKETKKIKKEHLNRLKKICDKLDLAPIGFMVNNEALSNLLQAEEGNPLSAIVADLRRNSVDLMLFRGGQISEAVTGPIHESRAATIDSLLKKFTAPVLPSRLIVTNAEDENDVSEELNNHTWSKSLPFLHIPQISIMPENFDIKAIIFGAASQLGFDVLGLHAFANSASIAQDDDKQIQPEETVDEIDKNATSENPNTNGSDNFGFVIDEDIANNPQLIEKAEKENATELIHQESKQEKTDIHESLHIESNDNNTSILSFENENHDKHETTKLDIKKGLLSGLLSAIPILKLPNIPTLSNFFRGGNKFKFYALIGLGIFVILIVIGFTLFKNSKAEIILSVKPEEVTIEKEALFSANAGNNFSKNIIAAEKVNATVNGETTIKATGKKDVGDKASGVITIYNSGNSPVSLNNGTEITSSNSLKFTLASDVKVASASGDIFSGTTPGTTDVKVEAKEIGTESNLPSGTKFTVGGNSSLAGKNDNAFSGGSKKTVTVVSEKDLSNLRKDLQNKLEKDAVKSLTEKSTSNTNIIPIILDAEFDEEKFDKKLNEETSQVKLTASILFSTLTYEKSQINDYAKTILKDKYSEDIIFSEDGLNIDITEPETENSTSINTKIKIKAGLLPEINTTEVIEKIKNKSPKEARNMLTALAQVEKIDIKFTPNLLFISNIFPRLPNELTIIVKAQ